MAVRVKKYSARRKYQPAQRKAVKFCPIKLDLEEVLKVKPPQFNYHIDNFRHIISLLYEIPANDRRKRTSEGFISIKGKKLQDAGIRHYKPYLDYLIDAEVIETDNHFIVGEKAKGYRLNPEYKSIIKPVSIHKSNIIKRIKKDVNAVYGYKYLTKWYDANLTIDKTEAEKYVFAQYQYTENVPYTEKLDKLNYNIVSINKINDLEIFFSVDKFSGRCHSNLTSASKDLRRFIKYNREPLTSIDIKNSQPFFSLLMFSPWFWSEKSKELNINRILKEDDRESIIGIMISLLEKTGDDIKKYASLVTTGQFYEYLSKEFNKHLSTDKQLTRPQVKKEVLKIFFSDNRYLNHPDAWQKRIFKQLFPTVYQIFETLKQGKKNRLALILQSIEREIVISKICKRIAIEYPNMVIYTIHDCIVSTKGNELIIKSIMEAEIKRLTDLKPILSIESWE